MSGMSILEEILAGTRVDLERRRRARPESAMGDGGNRRSRAFRDALLAPGLSIIAEHKRRSPSAGAIRVDSDVAAVARDYERGGAAAMSVLTEERHFGGSLDDLRDAHAACRLPLLRKDFIIDRYQLAEAVEAGASAVLLIVAALEPATLDALHTDARARGLDVLVEVHDGGELEVAIAVGAEIVGVNNRDLRDFSVDVERTFRLLELMPPQTIVVAESGIGTPEQLVRLRDAGVHAALVGERLMRGADPARNLAELLATIATR
jgi:indole-3-glycerol phosphate synthase